MPINRTGGSSSGTSGGGGGSGTTPPPSGGGGSGGGSTTTDTATLQRITTLETNFDALSNSYYNWAVGNLNSLYMNKANASDLDLKADASDLDLKADASDLDDKADKTLFDQMWTSYYDWAVVNINSFAQNKANVSDLATKADASKVTALETLTGGAIYGNMALHTRIDYKFDQLATFVGYVPSSGPE